MDRTAKIIHDSTNKTNALLGLKQICSLVCRLCAVTVLTGSCWAVRTSCRSRWTPNSACFRLILIGAVGGMKSFSFRREPRSDTQVDCVLTCLRKIRCSRLRLGLSGVCDQTRSGDRDPAGPKVFSSLKHPVSITYRQRFRRFRWKEEDPGFSLDMKPRIWTYLVLPVDWNAARVELGVEVVVLLVQSDPLHCGKLFDVLHVAAVHQPGLEERKHQQSIIHHNSEVLSFTGS